MKSSKSYTITAYTSTQSQACSLSLHTLVPYKIMLMIMLNKVLESHRRAPVAGKSRKPPSATLIRTRREDSSLQH